MQGFVLNSIKTKAQPLVDKENYQRINDYDDDVDLTS